jgi:hypothetical protein
VDLLECPLLHGNNKTWSGRTSRRMEFIFVIHSSSIISASANDRTFVECDRVNGEMETVAGLIYLRVYVSWCWWWWDQLISRVTSYSQTHWIIHGLSLDNFLTFNTYLLTKMNVPNGNILLDYYVYGVRRVLFNWWEWGSEAESINERYEI